MQYANIEGITGLLKTARNYASITQEELAKRLGTKQPVISREEHKGIKDIARAEQWAKACGFNFRLHHISIEKGIPHENGFSSYTTFVGELEEGK